MNEPTTPSTIRCGEPLWCADCKSYHPIGLHTDTPSDALELARRADEAEAERDAAIQLIKELNATKYQHGRQYRSRCGQFLSTINRNKQ